MAKENNSGNLEQRNPNEFQQFPPQFGMGGYPQMGGYGPQQFGMGGYGQQPQPQFGMGVSLQPPNGFSSLGCPIHPNVKLDQRGVPTFNTIIEPALVSISSLIKEEKRLLEEYNKETKEDGYPRQPRQKEMAAISRLTSIAKVLMPFVVTYSNAAIYPLKKLKDGETADTFPLDTTFVAKVVALINLSEYFPFEWGEPSKRTTDILKTDISEFKTIMISVYSEGEYNFQSSVLSLVNSKISDPSSLLMSLLLSPAFEASIHQTVLQDIADEVIVSELEKKRRDGACYFVNFLRNILTPPAFNSSFPGMMMIGGGYTPNNPAAHSTGYFGKSKKQMAELIGMSEEEYDKFIKNYIK